MVIDKAKFMHQFQLEVSEHLSNLYRGLVHLQNNSEDKSILKALMIDAHTISGTSAMMGLQDISMLARSLENGYMRVFQRAGKMNLTQFDVSFRALLSIASEMDQQSSAKEPAKMPDAGSLSKMITEAFLNPAGPLTEGSDEEQAGDSAASSAKRCPPGKMITVLVVDDAPVITAFGREVLEGAGYKVFVACDGEEALHLLEHLHFDLIVTDVSMPQMDGITLTRRVKQDGRFKDIPVIIMSTRSSLQEVQRGQQAGADAYLAKKDFTVEKLLNVVHSLIFKEPCND
jgi:CheY-like chemotaxis protein